MKKSLSSVIEEYRIRKGWSQRELATIAKVSNSTVARIESGESFVLSKDTLNALAGALDMDCNYLLSLYDQLEEEPEGQPIV